MHKLVDCVPQLSSSRRNGPTPDCQLLPEGRRDRTIRLKLRHQHMSFDVFLICF